MRDIWADYIAGAPDLMRFYGPGMGTLFSGAAGPVPSGGLKPELVEALNAYQDHLGGGGRVTGDELVVVTGQQTGLFTGPLYTVYKAITAILLARKVEETHGRRCVPVFWLAGDDHDFEEARTAHFLSKSNEPISLQYHPTESVEGLPMHRVRLDASVHVLIDKAAAQTRGSDLQKEVTLFLHDSLDAADSLADWTGRLMARLFAETRLVFVAPHLSAMRESAAAVVAKELELPLASTKLLNETGGRLAALGYPQQVEKAEQAASFFLEMGGRRRKVTYDGERFYLPEEDLTCSRADLLALLDCAPQRFSPNVALRCVVQQHLLGPSACVVGPGELAYWAQLKPAFEHFGEPMPVVWPRIRCALTTTKLKKLMDELGFAVGDLEQPFDALVEKALERSEASPARQTVQERRGGIVEALEGLAAALAPQEPTASDMARQLAENMKSGLDRLEETILKSDAARVDATRKKVARLCNSLAPWRKPQERVYTVFSFLFEHGWGLIPRLTEALSAESFTMQEVEL